MPRRGLSRCGWSRIDLSGHPPQGCGAADASPAAFSAAWAKVRSAMSLRSRPSPMPALATAREAARNARCTRFRRLCGCGIPPGPGQHALARVRCPRRVHLSQTDRKQPVVRLLRECAIHRNPGMRRPRLSAGPNLVPRDHERRGRQDRVPFLGSGSSGMAMPVAAFFDSLRRRMRSSRDFPPVPEAHPSSPKPAETMRSAEPGRPAIPWICRASHLPSSRMVSRTASFAARDRKSKNVGHLVGEQVSRLWWSRPPAMRQIMAKDHHVRTVEHPISRGRPRVGIDRRAPWQAEVHRGINVFPLGPRSAARPVPAMWLRPTARAPVHAAPPAVFRPGRSRRRNRPRSPIPQMGAALPPLS